MNILIERKPAANLRRARFAGSFILLFAIGLVFSKPLSGAVISTGFAPGEVWPDTDGNPINAHGGGVLFHEGVYYWCGESKAGRTYLPDCNKSCGGTRVDVVGVSCYSSTNLS